MSNNNWTIVMFPKIQIDTAVSYFLLKYFGEDKFPGIRQADVEFWTELPENKTVEKLQDEGYILLDLGNSKFDHHRLGQNNRKISSAHMVAKYLGVDSRADLKRLLEFARRDDLEGKGILSNDPIDRAFGLSALLTNLNRSIPDDPKQILDIVVPLLVGHFAEENRRHEILPKEFKEAVESGRAKKFIIPHRGKDLKIVYIESDSPALAGYVRCKAVGADLVIQKASTGHVNFVTRQASQVQLHKLARAVKLLEAQKNEIELAIESEDHLEKPGRTEGLPHWFYDARANTLQNGGIQPQGIPPTKLTYEEIEQVTKQGLNVERTQRGNFRERGNRDSFGGYKVSKGKGVTIIE